MKTKSTFETTVKSLCEEVDFWKEQSAYWEDKYNQERKENDKIIKENLIESQKGVANALMFCLSVREGENGELVIPKEDRERLSEDLKS